MNLFTLLTLTLSFISIACAADAGASSPVLDYKGDPVEAGVAYNIWGVGENKGPIALGRGLGDSPHCTRNVICRPNRWPEPYIPDPVSLYGVNSSESYVQVGQDYNFIFYRNAERPCNVWQVNLDIGSTNHNFITTGGQSGHPGCWNVNTWFQLQLVDDVEHLYKIIFNPHVCNKNNHCPQEITLAADGAEDRMYLNQLQFLDRPWINVRFTKHTSTILEEASEW